MKPSREPCSYQVVYGISDAKNQKQRDVIYEKFVKDGSDAFDNATNICEPGATRSIDEFKVANHIVSDLWFAVGCNEIDEKEFYKIDKEE
jgi:hypothetical protein